MTDSASAERQAPLAAAGRARPTPSSRRRRRTRVAEDARACSASSAVEHAPRPSASVGGLGGEPHLDALDAAGQEGERRVARRRRARRSAARSRSASPHSLSPHVRSTRLTMTAVLARARAAGRAGRPARASPSSRTARRARRRRPCRRPGRSARAPCPGVCGMTVAPTGHDRPGAGCSRACAGRAPRTCCGCASATVVVAHELDAHHLGDGLAGDVVLGRAEPAAHDHRVGCGRAPARSAATMRPRLSPTLVWKWRVDAGQRRAARRSTTSWCRRSGRAAARCRRRRPRSARTAHDDARRRASATVAGGRRRYCAPVTTVRTDGDPQQRVGQPRRRRPVSGSSAKPTASSCTTRLHLGQLAWPARRGPAGPTHDAVDADRRPRGRR